MQTMEDKVRIHIQLGDVKHPLVIEREEEPVARKAARLLTERYESYATKFRATGLPKEYLMAMAGLDMAMRFVRQDADSNAEAAGEALTAIVDELQTYLAPVES